MFVRQLWALPRAASFAPSSVASTRFNAFRQQAPGHAVRLAIGRFPLLLLQQTAHLHVIVPTRAWEQRKYSTEASISTSETAATPKATTGDAEPGNSRAKPSKSKKKKKNKGKGKGKGKGKQQELKSTKLNPINAFPRKVRGWFSKLNWWPRTTNLHREYQRYLELHGLDSEHLEREQWIRRRNLQWSFARACGAEFASNTRSLRFMQELCVRYRVPVGKTRVECIKELDKIYVNVHDAILMDGNRRGFKTQEAFSRDAAQRPFPKEVAKELGLRVFLKHLWVNEGANASASEKAGKK